MAKAFLRRLLSLELEEQILNIGVFIALVGVFFPWIGGEWLGGDTVNYTGLGFYTSVIGLAVCLLQVFVLLMTLSPLVGARTLVSRRYREVVRLCATSCSAILVLAALSVLVNVTFEFSRMGVRFGIYMSLIGSLVASLYSFLRFQEQRKNQVQEIFRHPEDDATDTPSHVFPSGDIQDPVRVPPPPPPPKPEDHRLFPDV